jgi:hypothetical protein
MDLVLPRDLYGLKQADIKNRYARSVKENGRFVTLGDESGLRLVDEQNRQVFVKEHDKVVPFRMTWSELKSTGFLQDTPHLTEQQVSQ